MKSTQKSKNSAYYLMFRLIIIIVASILILLGAIVVNSGTDMIRKNELSRVKSAGDLYISCITDEYTADMNDYLNKAAYFSNKFACEQSVRVYLFDTEGKCIASPDGSNSKTLKKSIMKKLEKEDFLDLDSEHLSQSVPSLTYITKFFLRESDGKYIPRYCLGQELQSRLKCPQ